MSIKVVAFDVDGTLYPNSLMYLRSIPFALRNLRFLRAFAAVRAQLRNTGTIDDFHERQAELFGRRVGMSTEAAREFIHRTFYGEWEKAVKGISPYPRLRETLEEFSRVGLKLALLSDFPFGNKLAYLGLEGFWNYRLSAEDTGYIKPNARPFLALLEHFRCSPQEMLYVGNDYECDIVGAVRVGCRAGHLARVPPRKTIADITFSDYNTLRSWVLANLGRNRE